MEFFRACLEVYGHCQAVAKRRAGLDPHVGPGVGVELLIEQVVDIEPERERVAEIQLAEDPRGGVFRQEEIGRGHAEALADMEEAATHPAIRRAKLEPPADLRVGLLFGHVDQRVARPDLGDEVRVGAVVGVFGVDVGVGQPQADITRQSRIEIELETAALRLSGWPQIEPGGCLGAIIVNQDIALVDPESGDRRRARDAIDIGGYTQDLKKIEGTERLEIENLPKPSTTASEVKDRKTLEDFVKEAARITKEQFDKGPNLSVPRLRNSFRKKAEDGGHWKSGSVYIWVVSGQNINLFHGANQNLEHEFANLDRLDDNGNEFIKILVNGARQDKENGRFLEYTYNNPTTTDDGDEPKLGFAYSVNLGPFLGDLVIGSGIYTGDLPETTKTTAKDVKDDDTETLKAFVEWAKSEIEPVTDVTKAAEIGLQLRGEDDDGNKKPNDFNDGDDTYLLVVLERTGDLLTHGKNRDFESKNLLEFRDDGGKRVIKQLIDKAKNEGGGFVKYQDDEGNTKSAYAVSYGDKIGRETYVLVGGGTLKTSPRLLT